jgi:hypothetical protein
MISAYVITLACAHAYYGEACRKGSEAFGKQTGIEQTTGTLEGMGRDRAKTVARTYLGNDTIRMAGLVYGGYHVYQTKSVKFEIPNYGLADHVEAQIQTTSGQLNFKWHFN